MTNGPVVAGPRGHWYTWHEGELVALPKNADGETAPTHPTTLSEEDLARSGWYAPDDLQGDEREAVLDRLGNARQRTATAVSQLDEHVAPELRPQGWKPARPFSEDEPDQSKQRAAATFYDPHGNHVETITGPCDEVGREAGDFLSRMAADGYPCTVIIEPEEAL